MERSTSPYDLGTESYREGSMLRLGEAQVFYREQKWVGCIYIYLAGRAAESILRSLLWAKQKQREVSHDLKDLLKRVRLIMRFSTTDENHLDNAVNELAVVWRNDLRFTGEARFKRMLDKTGRLQRIGSMRIKGDPLKANAKRVLEAAEKIVNRGEPYAKKIAG